MKCPLVIPTLIAVNVLVVVSMAVSGHVSSDPDVLAAYGANVPSRTTGGEWWRLVAASFVHAGWLHLLVSVGALVQVGIAVERIVGRAATVFIYMSAAIAGAILSLSADPLTPTLGSSVAVFALYGVFVACTLLGLVRGAAVTVPPVVLLYFAPGAAAFMLFNAFTRYVPRTAELWGFLLGLGTGAALVWRLGEQTVPWKRAAPVLAAPLLIAIVSIDAFEHVIDARPAMREVLALEARTSDAYDAAVSQFRKGRIQVEELIAMIENQILPQIEESQVRVRALTGVPREQLPLVAAAEEYLKLREESWRLRAGGLRTNDQQTLSRAEHTRILGLNALRQIDRDRS
jgi:membrane associated rhomboid family serine protease